MSGKKIVKARITDMPKTLWDPMPKVMVVFEGETEERELFDYYPDEISFTPSEFIGLTEQESRSLKAKKDKAYLQS